MSKVTTFALFFLATFLQSGTYGLTFMLPRLFAEFGANEKYVGAMLLITAITTLVSVYYSGHITDKIGRMLSLGLSGFAIAISLAFFSLATNPGLLVIIASGLLGIGWGLFYTLGPVVLTNITPPSQRVRVFSLNSVFLMAGFGLSPVFAAILESQGLEVADAFSIVAAVCVVSGILFIVLRPHIQAMDLAPAMIQKSSLTGKTIASIFTSSARLPIVMVCLGASVFAGMSNFQTVFADTRALNYADFFLTYTVTVIVCRLLLTGFSGGKSPYGVIAALQYVMCASVLLFIFSGSNQSMYVLVAILFGIGYGASYPVLVAMAANDSPADLVPQTLQLFALTYFVGIFGFPLIAGWVIVEQGAGALLTGVAVLALMEASMALYRYKKKQYLNF